MRRRPVHALVAVTLLAVGLLLGPAAAGASGPGSPPQTSPTTTLTATDNPSGGPTLLWSLRGSSERINVLPNLRCDLGPDRPGSYMPATDPCLWLADESSPAPGSPPPNCPEARKPDIGGPTTFASWRCDMSKFGALVISAAQNANDRTVMMFNDPSTGGSGLCAGIPITVLLGKGYGELQAADGCPQTIRCDGAYTGTIRSDERDTVSGCASPPPPTGGGSGGGGTSPPGRGGGSYTPPATGQGSAKAPKAGGGSCSGTACTGTSGSGGKKQSGPGASCPGAASGNRGNSPLYSVYIKARGKRGMVVYVHMRRAVPITVDVRMRRGSGGGAKIVRWVSRCAKKGTNVITFPNATGGAQSRRSYRVIVKSPNSTYPLRASWETLPRR